MFKDFKKYAIIYYLWIIIFVVLPILLIFIQSFLDMNHHFNLINYKTFFSSTYLKMTFNSIIYALLITLICLMLAFPTAYLILKTKYKKILLILLILPSWINLLLKTYAFMGLLATKGFLNNILVLLNLNPVQFLFTIKGFLIVSIYIFIPFMILPIYNSIEQIPENLIKAAQDLGANKWQIIKKIIIPLSKNGINAGIQVVFIPSLSIFMITRLIAGNQIITLGTAIEEHFLVTGNWGMGAAIGSILIISLFLSIFIVQYPRKKFLRKKNVDIPSVGGANV